MADDEDSVRPPRRDHPDDELRAIITTLIDTVPIASAFTNLFDRIKPSQAERAREIWEEVVSTKINEHRAELERHEQAINPREVLPEIAGKLALRLAECCPDGLRRKFYNLEDLCNLLPAEPASAVNEAVQELVSYGLLKIDYHFNGWYVRLTPSFYEQIDRQTMGWNTVDDAAAIAERIVESNEGQAQRLHEATGWPLRRFNPAFAYVIEFFPPGRISGEMDSGGYSTRFVIPLPEDIATLRRFLRKRRA